MKNEMDQQPLDKQFCTLDCFHWCSLIVCAVLLIMIAVFLDFTWLKDREDLWKILA